MFLLAAGKRLFQYTGLLLILLHLSLFILGLPPFHIGLWIQTEQVALGLYTLSMLTGLWLAAGIVFKRLIPTTPQPLWKVLLLWTIWQGVSTVTATSPWRSWFGHPQTSEGMAWYVAQLLMVMLIFPFWQVARYRSVILWAAILNTLAMGALYLLIPRTAGDLWAIESWTPVQWGSFLGFIALYLAIASVRAGLLRERAHYLIMLPVFAAILWVSGNLSAMILGGCAIVTCVIASRLYASPSYRFALYPGNGWRNLLIASTLLPFLWIGYCYQSPDTTSFGGNDSGLGSRMILNHVAVATLQYEPNRLWMGDGWGRFSDDIFKYITVAPTVRIYQGAERAPTSFMVDGGAFHSHSQPLEALLSLGIIGGLLWFAIPAVALRTLPERNFWQTAPLLVAVTMLGFFWFEVLECIPFRAIALVSLIGVKPYQPSIRSGTWKALPLLLVCAAMGWSGKQQAEAIIYDLRLRALQLTDTDLAWINDDIKRGGDRLRTLLPYHLMYLASASDKGTITNPQIETFKTLVGITHALAKAPHTGACAAFLSLWTDYITFTATGHNLLIISVQDEAKSTLPTSVFRMTHLAPLRDDLATPFLQNIDKYGDGWVKTEMEWLNTILTDAPYHRGALWTKGTLLMATDTRKQEGLQLRNLALSLGLERVYPVTTETLIAPPPRIISPSPEADSSSRRAKKEKVKK